MDKEKLKQCFSAIEKQHGPGTVFRLGSSRGLKVSVIPTTILPIDIATGVGGLPQGRVIEIYGPPSGGKTTLCLQTIASAQRMGGHAAFVDAEHALDPVYAAKLGVDVDNLIVSQPDNGEQALEVTNALIESEQFAVVVVDSVAALVPKKELEGEMGDHQMGSQARLMSQAMRKLNAVVSKTKTCLIFINQTRFKVGVMFGNPETTSGGEALKFAASMRITVRPGAAIKNGDNQIGSQNKIKIVKNKVASPFKEAVVNQIYGMGFEPVENNFETFLELGLIKKAEKGAHYYALGSEDSLGNGKENSIDTLRLDVELYDKLYLLAREKAFAPKTVNPATPPTLAELEAAADVE